MEVQTNEQLYQTSPGERCLIEVKDLQIKVK